MKSYQPDLFDQPIYERRADIPSGVVFQYGGRALLVVKSYGTDAAAPVIVEELTNAVTLKGQLAIWGAEDIRKRMRLVEDCMAGLARARLAIRPRRK